MDPNQILRANDVAKLVNMPKQTIYHLRLKGMFPDPIRLGEKAMGWRYSQIVEWLDSLPSATDKTYRPRQTEEAVA